MGKTKGKTKQARNERAKTCLQPHIPEKIFRKMLPNGKRLAADVPVFLAGAVDKFLEQLLLDSMVVSGGEKKHVDVVHIAKCLVDSDKPYHGLVPPVANVHLLDPNAKRDSEQYLQKQEELRAMELADDE